MDDQIIVHSYDWQTGTDKETGYTTIHAWGLDRDSKPHLLRFHDFEIFCYVELPLILNNSYVRWQGFRERIIYDAICYKLGDDRPHRYMYVQREKLYFFKGLGADGKPKTYPMLLLCFHSISAMKACKRKLGYAFKVCGLRGGNKYDDQTTVSLRVWETEIPVVRKLLTLRNCKFSQWFKITGIKVTGEDKISTLENEYVVDWKTLDPIPPEETMTWLTKPTIFSFDLETYSDRHNAMPDPYCSKHVIYMVSVVFQRLREPETRKTDIILFGDCAETNLANVIKVNSEMELIEALQDLIIKYDPDIISGYNILGYDNPYLDTRLKRRLKEWRPLGRLINQPSSMNTMSWSSSAYKNQEFNLLDMEGRISIDLLPLIRRDFKLPLYNLNFVSKHFLGKGKHDVTAKQMFEIYEMQECLNNYDPGKIPESFKKYCKEQELTDTRTEWIKQHRIYALDQMKKVVDYCVVDSDLVVDLFEKINVWISLISMSSIMGITPTEIFTRGTGVRMISQIYDEATKNNIVLDQVDFPKSNYEGGFVFSPISGIYHNIPCLDFSSLYPSIMITENIDHMTCVPPELMDKIPDEDCNVIEWDDEQDDSDSDSDSDNSFEEKKKKKKNVNKKKKIVHHKYKFVKEPQGIMPRLLTKLIAERNNVRKKQKLVPRDSLEWNILEQTQLGIKIICNSFYGSCGSSYSTLKLPYAAASITAKARESTKKMNAYIESKGHKIVYGDTDSTMPDIGITDTKTAWEKAGKLADELTALYKKPMNVELEAIFSTMLSIKKKMYLCINMDRDGNPIEDAEKMKIRGVTLARRDNCKFQREFYKATVWKVMHREPFMDTFNFIIDKCIQLLSRGVSWEDLVMIKGLGSHYKSKTYMMKIFADEMEKSGNPMVAGDRIPYLVVETKDGRDKIGFKMRTVELFTERAKSETPEHIDYLLYLEKTIRNGIEKQLFQIGYKAELEELDIKYKKIDLERFFQALEDKLTDKNDPSRDIKLTGYRNKLKQMLTQNSPEEVAKLLSEDKALQKIAKPLYSYHVNRRQGRSRRLSSRVDKEPILMMVRIMRAKEEVMKSIREYTPKPRIKRKLVLKIV